MDILDIFNEGNELFTKASIADHVDVQPHVPDHTSKWFDWNSQGETTDRLVIEFTEGNLAMIPEAVRGAPGDAPERDVDSGVPVRVPHFPQRDALLASQFMGVRMSGSELLETVENKRNQLLAKFNRRNRLMWEVSRIGAITGLVINYKNQVSKNWFTEFGVDQTTAEIDFAGSNTKIRTALMKARDKGAEKLGDLTATRWVAVCGTDRFDSVVDHPSFEKAVERWNDGAALRDDLSGGFPIASDITLVKYTRASVAGKVLIGPNDMYLCPVAEGMYQTRFAPGTAMEDLGTLGKPEYVYPKVLDFNEGVEFKAQTNVLSYVQRLEAIVKVSQG